MLTFIPDLAEEHFDELQFLWSQRRRALRSPAYDARALGKLEERIEARVEGVLVIGERVPEFVEPALRGEDELPAFAAAFALLRLGTPDALGRVADALESAKAPVRDGLAEALAHGPAAPLAHRLTALVHSAAPPLGAAAAEALVFHGALTPSAKQLERFLRAEEPDARARGWRIAAYSGAQLPADWYERGLGDDDPAVSRAAVTAAAWSASPAFAPYCRARAATPTPESIEPLVVFAAVARPEEYQVVEAVATSAAAGPGRFRVPGSFGHPYFVELLVTEMSNPDPAVAAAAGAAFSKMTGRDVESGRRAPVPPDGKPPADEFEAEFQDEVFLPDPELARRHWHELYARLAHAPRLCRGFDVSQPLTHEQFAALDTESRWEHCLRARLGGGWQGTPLFLERYPQRG